MSNDQMITLKLFRNDVGQVIDGLAVRRENWRYTQRYLEEGYMEDGRIIEECSSAEEASSIADCYDRIISEIQSQLR